MIEIVLSLTLAFESFGNFFKEIVLRSHEALPGVSQVHY